MEKQRFVNASLVAGLLAILGVGLFILIYVALGAAGVADAPRLLGALFAPPAVIALVIGAYARWGRRG